MKKSILFLSVLAILAILFLAGCASRADVDEPSLEEASYATAKPAVPATFPPSEDYPEITNLTDVTPKDSIPQAITPYEAVEAFRRGETVPGYTLDDGYVSQKGHGYVGDIHTYGMEFPRSAKQLSHSEYTTLYQFGNILVQYSMGKIFKEITLPDGAVYGGHSFWCGYLFRVENKLYAVNWDGFSQQYAQEETGLKLLCEGVQFIIEPNYRLNSDAWSQPLLLMEDGSIKAYVSWGEEHLQDPWYEGGYGGTPITD